MTIKNLIVVWIKRVAVVVFHLTTIIYPRYLGRYTIQFATLERIQKMDSVRKLHKSKRIGSRAQ